MATSLGQLTAIDTSAEVVRVPNRTSDFSVQVIGTITAGSVHLVGSNKANPTLTLPVSGVNAGDYHILDTLTVPGILRSGGQIYPATAVLFTTLVTSHDFAGSVGVFYHDWTH